VRRTKNSPSLNGGAVDGIMDDGDMYKVGDLFKPTFRPVQAVVCLVLRPRFSRLWIVQEFALASTLELHCVDSSRYGYIAEELCRDRSFFIMKAGRLGLGSVH
jgi:hypothetical protein